MIASYKTMNILSNTVIRSDNFSCIAFQNIGETDCKINDIILQPGNSLNISEKDSINIATDFNVNFDGGSGVLNIIITYYHG